MGQILTLITRDSGLITQNAVDLSHESLVLIDEFFPTHRSGFGTNHLRGGNRVLSA